MSKLKKFLASGGLILLTAAAPKIAHAQFQGTNYWQNLLPTDLFTWGTLNQLIRNIITILLIVAGLIAFVYLIYGGYQYITAGGNAEQATAARTTILNSIIGLLVIFASYAVLVWVMGQFLTTR